MKRSRHRIVVLLLTFAMVAGTVGVQPASKASARYFYSYDGYEFTSEDTVTLDMGGLYISEEEAGKVKHVIVNDYGFFFKDMLRFPNAETLYISGDTMDIDFNYTEIYDDGTYRPGLIGTFDLPNLKEIIVDESNEKYVSYEGALYTKATHKLLYSPDGSCAQEFENPTVTNEGIKDEESIVIPKNMHFHHWFATDVYPNVKEVQFEEGTTYIDEYVFYCFPNVTKIVIPKTVTNMGNWTFDSNACFKENKEDKILQKLQQIEVDVENPVLTSIDGVLYNKDVTKLICFPNDSRISTYEMPSTLIRIDTDAFGNNQNLQKIVIGKEYKHDINDSMYSYTKNLTNLTDYSVDKENQEYAAVDGILYNQDKTILYAVPCGRVSEKLELLSGVELLSKECFGGAKIEELVLPSSIVFTKTPNDYAVYDQLSQATEDYFIDNQVASFSIKDNDCATVIDGVLYSKDLTEILCWPARKTADVLQFPSTLKYLYDLPNMEQAKQLMIPRDLESVNWHLNEKNSLEKITIEKGNQSFKVINNLLYPSDLSELLVFPVKAKIKTLNLPSKTEFVSDGCIQSMSSITTVIVNGKANAKLYNQLPNLKEFKIKKGNKNVKLVKGVLYSADQKQLICYPAAKTGKSFTVPSTVTKFNPYTFYIQKYVEKIILPKKLNLTKDLKKKYEASSWFINCTKLKEIQVSSGNTDLSAKDGVLYDKNKKTLICYPSAKTAKTFKVPESVSIIHVGVRNKNLTTLQLGKGFTEFLDNKCWKCRGLEDFPNLTKITVSKSDKTFVVKDNVLYKKYNNPYDTANKYLILIAYPMGKKNTSYTFDSNVYLGFYQWDAYTNLETIKSLNVDVTVVDKHSSDQVKRFGEGK